MTDNAQPQTPAELELEIFRAGDYGPKGAYTVADLDAIAADYDAQRHEAPVTLDHEQRGPAFGWVKSLARNGDRLIARLHSLSADLLESLRAGAYKKRSAELYRAFAPTGRPYLRAVSFLGACPPEIKGLADPVFQEGEADSIEFEAPIDPSNIPSHLSESSASSEPFMPSTPPLHPLPSFAEREAALLDRIHTTQTLGRRAQITATCDRLRTSGRLIPAWERMGLQAFMESLDQIPTSSFSEEFPQPSTSSNSSPSIPSMPSTPSNQPTLLHWFEKFLETLPALIPFGEAAPDPIAPSDIALALPREMRGAALDADALTRHRRALQLRSETPALTYAEALSRSSSST